MTKLMKQKHQEIDQANQRVGLVAQLFYGYFESCVCHMTLGAGRRGRDEGAADRSSKREKEHGNQI